MRSAASCFVGLRSELNLGDWGRRRSLDVRLSGQILNPLHVRMCRSRESRGAKGSGATRIRENVGDVSALRLAKELPGEVDQVFVRHAQEAASRND